MKRLFLFCLILISGIIFCQEKTQKLDSKVIAATVFKNRALVTRQAEILLPSGRHVLAFSNLPTDLQNESVRVAAEGNGVIKILDVKVEQRFTSEIQQDNIKKLEQKIDSLNQQKNIASDKIAVYNSKKEFVESLKAQSAKFVNEKMLLHVNNIKEWNDMLKYVGDNLRNIYSGLREQNEIINAVEEQKNAIQAEINISRGRKTKNYKEVIVTIENNNYGKIKLYPSYLVQSANWYPLYDARVISENKQAELSYFGMIHQSTGEDWRDISLTLSTAEPMSIKSLPELERWFIDTKPLPVRHGAIKRIVDFQNGVSYEQNFGIPGGNGSISGYVIDKSTGDPLVGANVTLSGKNIGSATDLNGKFLIPNIPEGHYILNLSYIGYQPQNINVNVIEKNTANLTLPLQAHVIRGQEVVVTANEVAQKSAISQLRATSNKKEQVKYTNVYAKELSTSFEIKTKSSIPSDNSQHKVTIAIENLPVEYSYTSIPKISPSVYLKGKIVNTNNYPFLEGEINIFIDNDFINRTFLKTIVPTDTLELALGIDDKIQIKKVLINKFQESKGFLSGNKQISYEYEIQITNNRPTEESVLVYDQLPIPMNEDIKVNLLEPKKEKEELGNDQKLEWNIRIKPGEKKIIPVKYTVEYPDDINVYGLE